jgi:hypothetical protein
VLAEFPAAFEDDDRAGAVVEADVVQLADVAGQADGWALEALAGEQLDGVAARAAVVVPVAMPARSTAAVVAIVAAAAARDLHAPTRRGR